MKIEVWSDYVCPFCYIGKRLLEQAIQQSTYEGSVEIVYKSYLLDPTTPVDAEESVYTSLARKYSMTETEVKAMTSNVVERAKEVGLQYNFEQMKTANTMAAHRLAKLAKVEGKEKEWVERVLQAYFTEGAAIGREDILIQLAGQVGLSSDAVIETLNNHQFEAEIEQDLYEAQQIGIRGVPFFVFNNKYGISGAEPLSLFVQTIEQAAQVKPTIVQTNTNGATCTGDECKF